MRNVATRVALGLLVLVASAGAAWAGLRSPQVAISGDCLQGLLNSKGESINVATDQQDAQTWATTISNNSTFTLMMELSANAAGNTIGLYNGSAAVPPLYLMFPGAATTGWFATASFRSAPTRVVVNLFDNNANFVGSTTYLAGPPDASNFGFYIQGPGTGGVPLFTQDARNPGGLAYGLAFAGTGLNSGSWWLALEDQIGERDFCDELIFLESVNPTPVTTTTWGALRARFR
jgi:hypothetical protein